MAEGARALSKLRSLLLVSSGAGVFFAGYCIIKGNTKFYNNAVMPTMSLLPPETSHKLAVLACKYKIFSPDTHVELTNLHTKFYGKNIASPLGIAAGFDKQCEAVEGLERLGFGFVEIGTVTPEPQSGNPTPRVFRLVADNAIINRYGFNSVGHQKVYKRLCELKISKHFDGIVGVNLGKNKQSSSPIQDYVEGVKLFGPVADYLVINVSSPNTPGLRAMQGKKELEQLLTEVVAARSQLPHNNKVPILLKLSPDLSKQDIKDISAVIAKQPCRIDGLIVSNTTVSRKNLKSIRLAKEIGGLSGAPLRSKSTKLIAQVYDATKGTVPIIGVGGISSGQDAFEKLQAGASFLQIYTAFIYHGPPVVATIKNELSFILKQQGYNSVSEVVGKNYKKYLDDV